MNDDSSVRLASISDIPLLVGHRRAMLIDNGTPDDAAMAEMSVRFSSWVSPRLADGTYRAWIVECEHGAVASASLWLKEAQPRVNAPQERVAYVLNVYTEPSHRRLGHSRRLMELIVETCKSEEWPVIELHTSESGRHLYESLGFKPTNEMRLALK